MVCHKAQYLLSTREQGEVERQRARELKKHLVTWSLWREAEEDFEELDRLLASLAEPEVPDGYWDSLL